MSSGAIPPWGRADTSASAAWFDATYTRNAISICFGEQEVLTDANDAFLQLIGWTREQFVASPPSWRVLAQHYGTDADLAAKAEAVTTGTWSPMETGLRHRDGHWVPVVLGGTVYDPERFRWVAYAFDLTRQRAAEHALARSEERLALAVAGASDGIWDWDLATGHLFLSARCSEIAGYGPHERTTSGFGLMARVHPEDVGHAHGALVAALKQRQPLRLEMRVRREDGTWQWIALRGEATYHGDRAHRLTGTISDIGPRKLAERQLAESEHRHALALRATRDGMFEAERGAEAIWLSARAAEILEIADLPNGGMAPLSRVTLGQSPEDQAVHTAAARRAAETGEPYDVELARTRFDGTRQWIRVRGVPDRSRDGVVHRFVGSLSDITTDVAARDALHASEASVRQAQKMDALGRLASGIAHDFNNLLAVILGYVEVGLASAPEGAPGRALREIGVAGQRARDLVRHILAFARLPDTQRGTDAVPVSVADALRETTRMLEATMSSGITLSSDVAPDVGYVLGDVGGLQQVLVNLAMNAEHAMRERGGRLTLGAAFASPELVARMPELSADRSYVRVWVQDTGVGIPQELLDRVVEPFFTTKAQGEGTGLGLSVAHGIARGWGGALRLSSVLGEGTVVDVLLPVATSPNAPAMAPTQGSVPSLSGQVLVVDDDRDVAGVMAERLRLFGLSPVTAHSASDALTKLEAAGDAIGLVLADRAMPEDSGEWLAQEVQRRWPRVAVAIMTGDRADLTDERVAAAGILAVLDKPLSGEALQALVQRVFGARADRVR